MKQKLGLLKLTGNDAARFGTYPLTEEMLSERGIPADAETVRRYNDIEGVTVVLSHPSFDEVEDGAQIPVLKTKAAPGSESIRQAEAERSRKAKEDASEAGRAQRDNESAAQRGADKLRSKNQAERVRKLSEE